MVDRSRWNLRFREGEPAKNVLSGEWVNRTIADSVEEMAAITPDRVLYTDAGAQLTARSLLDHASRLARGLDAMGLRAGDTISFQLPNWMEAAVINLACALGGFVINPIVPIYRQQELSFILSDARTKMLFIPDVYRGMNYVEMAQALRSALPGLEHIVVVRGRDHGLPTYDDVMERGRLSKVKLSPAHPDAVKMVIYTSGTTGRAKGVLYTHNQGRRGLFNSHAFWRLDDDTKFLIVTPVTHVSGFSYGLDLPLHFGTQSLLMERWEPRAAREAIESEKVTAMIGATPFLQELVDECRAARSRVPSLAIFCCGGASIPPALVRTAYEVFESCRSFRVFGSTECPNITQGCMDDETRAATTDGMIVDYDAQVVDDAGNPLPVGEEGEIVARGPAMFRGYTDLNATQEAFDAHGFFRTGDVGRISADGFITITGRKKDIIIRGGENLSAKEIEDALYEHEDIAEVAVIPVPHPRLGESVCAVVVAKGARRPDISQIGEFLRDAGFARQKWPERIEYVDKMPRTPSGKVQKFILIKDITG